MTLSKYKYNPTILMWSRLVDCDRTVVVEIDVGGGKCKQFNTQISWVEVLYVAFVVKKIFYRKEQSLRIKKGK